MTCKICDLCGKEITKAETSFSQLVIGDSVLGIHAKYDLHSQCAVRLCNKVNAFIKEARQQEGE